VTGIAFLDELRDDLMDAAVRSEERVARLPRSPRLRRPVSRWKLAAGLVTGVLVIAGVVGYVALGGPGTPTAGGVQADSARQEFRPAVAGPAPPHRFAGKQPTLANDIHEAPDVPSGGGGAGEGVQGTRLVGDVPAVGPNIVKTAELQIQVDRHTFSAQFQKAMAVAETYGGYVQTSSTAGTKTRSGYMTMRVPADKFALAVGDLRALGTVLHQEVSGVDVTARFVDLGARLKNALAQEASMRRLLGEAPSVASTLRVNGVLTDVELRIEELRGQLRVLRNRADLGTIRLDMREKGAQAAPATTPPPPVKKPQLSRAFEQAVAAFLGVVFSVVVGLGFVIPVLVLLVVAWVVVRRVRRARMAPA
jgi:Domain of unknown function (DUF4349)